MKAQKTEPFSEEKQKKLYDIILFEFGDELKRSNCILMTTLIKRVGKTIKENGFDQVNKLTFMCAPLYFKIGYNQKNACAVSLKDLPEDGTFSEEKFPEYVAETRVKAVKRLPAMEIQNPERFEDVLFSRLLQTYKTNEVSFKEITRYIKINKLKLPKEMGSFQELFDIMSEKFGMTVRDNGEGTVEESWLILRKTQPVPPEVRQQVEKIIAENFKTSELIPNIDIGHAMNIGKVDFRKYGYCDLTAFERCFKDIFIISSQLRPNTNKSEIFIKIHPAFLEQHQNDKCAPLFPETVCELFKAGNYQEIIERSVLRQALKYTDGDMWSCIFKAYFIVSKEEEKVRELTDWEKFIIDFGRLADDISDEFLTEYGLEPSSFERIKEYVSNDSFKEANYNIIAQRIRALCGENSPLIPATCELGLIAYSGMDKTLCFRMLTEYCSKKDIAALLPLWEKYSQNFSNAFNMELTAETLFFDRHFEILTQITDRYGNNDNSGTAVRLYQSLSQRILGLSVESLPSLTVTERTTATRLADTLLDEAVKRNNVRLFAELIYCCLKSPEKYVLISDIKIPNLTDNIINELCKGAEDRDISCWMTLSFLIRIGLYGQFEKWERISNNFKKELTNDIELSDNDEKIKNILTALKYFPNDENFTGIAVSCFKDIAPDVLEDAVNKLVSVGNYKVVIMLYENGNKQSLNGMEWFLRSLDLCYRRAGDANGSIKAQKALATLRGRKGNSLSNVRTELLNYLYDGAVSLFLTSLDSETVAGISPIFDEFICPNYRMTHAYCIAMMGLALCNRDIPMLSLLSCVCVPKNAEGDFMSLCEKAINEGSSGYYQRYKDLPKTYEYLLTHESPEVIFAVLKRVSNVVRHDADILPYEKEKKKPTNIETWGAEKITRLAIAFYNSKHAWELLSRFLSKNHINSTLIFTANIVVYYKFGSSLFYLENVTGALNRLNDANLPSNFVPLCMMAWNTKLGDTTKEFQSAFLDHVTRCGSFRESPKVMIDELYESLMAKNGVSRNDLILALEVAKQTHRFDSFCQLLFEEPDPKSDMLSANADIFIRFCAAFSRAADDAIFIRYQRQINEIRQRINTNKLDSKGRAALLWADELISPERIYSADDTFITASGEILSFYPSAPPETITKKWIGNADSRLPKYTLVRNYMYTFGSRRDISTINNSLRKYIRNHPVTTAMPKKERLEIYRLNCFLAERAIYTYDRDYSRSDADILRLCTTYLIMRKLTDDDTPVPASLKDRMTVKLEEVDYYSKYVIIKDTTDRLCETDLDADIKEIMLFCGSSGYWDKALETWLSCAELLRPFKEDVRAFLTATDHRKLARRLLQMYVYSYAADIAMNNAEADTEKFENSKYFKYYRSAIESEEKVFEIYHKQLKELIDVLQPELISLIEAVEVTEDKNKKLRRLKGIATALENKDAVGMLAGIHNADVDTLNNTLIPAVSKTHYIRYVKEMLLKMSYSCDRFTEPFLNSKDILEMIGESDMCLFSGVYHYRKGDAIKAADILSHGRPDEISYPKVYQKLCAAVSNHSVLELNDDELCVSVRVQEKLPAFSFVKTTEYNSLDLTRLISDFYAEGVLGSKERCAIARKIYSAVINGENYSDAIKFMFDWGFAEIDAAIDIERKFDYFCEMLEKINILPDYINSKPIFVRYFERFLTNLDFAFMIRRFDRILSCWNTVFDKFQPFPDSGSYAMLFSELKKLISLGSSDSAPHIINSEIDLIKSHIIELHLKYPQNGFIGSCIDHVDRYAKILEARGNFEVRILNSEKLFDNIIFYSVRNVGFDVAVDVTLTFSIKDRPEATKQVKISEIMLNGLRPNQVYSGEYVPTSQFNDGETIECSITIESPVTDENNIKYNRTYTAVDSSNGGTLRCVRNSSGYCYHKEGTAGYFTETVSNPDNFIGRREELCQILGKSVLGRNVVLYGTNGTGKSSLLNYISQKALPDIYNKKRLNEIINESSELDSVETNDRVKELFYGFQSEQLMSLGRAFVPEPLRFDDCNEKIIFSRIIRSFIDSKKVKLYMKTSGYDLASETLIMITEDWVKKEDSLFDENGRCIDTSSFRDILADINELLSDTQIEAYILIDQFERIMVSPSIDPEHFTFLGEGMSKIRFIIAGSNELLEAAAVEEAVPQKENAWQRIFSRGTTAMKIGNLQKKDFKALMTNRRALNNGELKFDPEALEYLWEYTNGHALYSCRIADRVLNIMSARGVNRDRIYTSDVFNAIYKPEENISDGESTKTIDEQIVSDIKDNIPVMYTGRTLAKLLSTGEKKISYEHLRAWVNDSRPDIVSLLDNALDILFARDFIQKNKSEHQNNAGGSSGKESKFSYSDFCFTSDLYLERFLRIDIAELSDEERKAQEHKSFSNDELIDELNTRNYSVPQIEKFREVSEKIAGRSGETHINIEEIGKVYGNGAVDQSIGQQNNYVLINNVFHTILTEDVNSIGFRQAFEQLSSGISGLIEPNQSNSLVEMETEKNTIVEGAKKALDDKASFEEKMQNIEVAYSAKCEEIEKKQEEITKPAIDQKLGEVFTAAASEDLINVNAERWMKLLGYKGEQGLKELNELKSRLGEFDSYLSVAVMIHNIMDKTYEKIVEANKELDGNDEQKYDPSQIDFCPVVIMYCKLVEAMLDKYHFGFYSGMNLEWFDPEKHGMGKYLFRFADENKYEPIDWGVSEPLPLKSEDDWYKMHIYLNRYNISLISQQGRNKKEWETHFKNLATLRGLRNRAAHTAQKINRQCLDWLVQALFKKGELLRIISLTEK